MPRGRLASLAAHAAVALVAPAVGGLVVRWGSPSPQVFQTFRVTSSDGAAAQAVLQSERPQDDRAIAAALAK